LRSQAGSIAREMLHEKRECYGIAVFLTIYA
jgi:hypothetical protein